MHKKTALLLVLAMIVASAGTAFAAGLSQDPTTPTITECAGTVTAVDPISGVVTITKPDGTTCSATIPTSGTTYDHPIVSLLGMYFKVKTDNLEPALESMPQICADPDTSDPTTYIWKDCGTGTGTITILGDNGDGTFRAMVGGTIITLEGVPDIESEAIVQALQTLTVNWTLDDTGTMLQAGDLIAQYHDDGMGFGVLVKLFALAQNSQTCNTITTETGEEEVCGPMNVDTLVQEFNSGTGMGQLFKEYGKPKLLGVGHVRQQNKNETTVNGDETEVQPNGNANHDQSDKVKPNNAIKNNKAKGPCNVPNNKNKNKCP